MKDYSKFLFPYAYNILGSCEDAKDVVQDVLSKYVTFPKNEVDNEKKYLIKSVINSAINTKKRTQKLVRQEVWLPEPIATEKTDDNLHLKDISSYALMVLFEQLNPKERAVFILREGFGYSHEEISEVLSDSIENSRTLLSRAKKKLNPKKQATKAIHEAAQTVLNNLITAIRTKDVKALENLLSTDVQFYADGGDTIPVVKKSCFGAREVSELFMLVFHTFNKNFTLTYHVINHQPALLYHDNEQLKACQIFSLSETGKIDQINSVIAPEKLKSLNTK
jgi:RNA polymerase sigma-70 factor (ECF subfamily)